MSATNDLDAEVPGEDAPKAEIPKQVLVIDVGGTKIKMLATGQSEPRKASSGLRMTPAKLVETAKQLADGWEYEAISLGFPVSLESMALAPSPATSGLAGLASTMLRLLDCPFGSAMMPRCRH
jgi:polyphosphate glucokinase